MVIFMFALSQEGFMVCRVNALYDTEVAFHPQPVSAPRMYEIVVGKQPTSRRARCMTLLGNFVRTTGQRERGTNYWCRTSF